MSVARGLVIIVASGIGFGAAGGLLGFTLGAGAPAYYRGVFRRGDDPGFRPVQVGLGLGITQGVACGLVIGSVIVLAVALSRRAGRESDPAGLPDHPSDGHHPRSTWLRRAFAIVFILAAVMCSGVVGFVVGAIVGQLQLYQQAAEGRLARVRPVLQERPFAGLQAESTSDGQIYLFGTVGSEPEYKALQDRMRFLFGDEDARLMTGGVDVVRK